MAGNLTSELMLVVPWPLLLVGLLLGVGADGHARLIRRATGLATWFSLLLAIGAAVTYGLNLRLSETYFSIPLPNGFGSLAINTDVNPVTVIMLLLVSFVGMIVARYSVTYMDGDDHEGRFHRWLSLTLGAFFTLIVVGNIWAFLISWIATSLFLHKLLAFYPDRPGAVLAARKKFFLHRLSDISLFGAFGLIAKTLNLSDFNSIAHVMGLSNGVLPQSLAIAGGLIVLSAILKSAQFPFHGWLIQVMEAPTPVSALLHAGIIYTGTFLLLRTSPIISRLDWAMDTLVLVGLLSIVVASLMMMVETNIKESLAYSTCAQMGFMLMECGLGLYSIAVIHIVAHSVYKAHAFLASGSVVDHFRTPPLPEVSRPIPLWGVLMGLSVSILITFGIGKAFGVEFGQQPDLMVLGGILVIAITLLILQSFHSHAGAGFLFAQMTGLSTLVVSSYFGLHWVIAKILGTSLPQPALPAGPVQEGILVLIVIVFFALLLVQVLMTRILESPFARAVYVHLYNGLYVDIILNRMLGTPAPSTSAGTMLRSGTIQSREVKP